MKAKEIRPNIYWMGAIDWDRRLFDALIPLPDGTSYNAYLVRGSEKTALVDSVDPTMADGLLALLEPSPQVDYIISQHSEQDHSGAIPHVLARYPNATVITSSKGKGMLASLLAIPEDKIRAVEDGESLSLGDKTLKFIYSPWVHWPETMVTYLAEDKVLFTCDLFGSHLASSDMYAGRQARVYEAAKRYYAEIMMPFRAMIQKNLDKLQDLAVSVIAPSHGPLYDQPDFIVEAYREWVSAQLKNVVVLPYISMHGSTRAMVSYLVDALMEKGVRVEQFDLSSTDIGKLAMATVDAATLVIGSPIVLAGLHPTVVGAAVLINTLKPPARFAAAIGSYGWGGKAAEQLAELLSGLKLELQSPVFCKGLPREADLRALDELASTIAEKHAMLDLPKR